MARSWFKTSSVILMRNLGVGKGGDGRSNMGVRIPDQFIHSLVTKNVPCLVSFLAFVTTLVTHLIPRFSLDTQIKGKFGDRPNHKEMNCVFSFQNNAFCNSTQWKNRGLGNTPLSPLLCKALLADAILS